MNRTELFTLLNSIIPTYSVGQLRGAIKQDLCILRRGVDLPSASNSLGHWDNWYIDIYSPHSVSNIDNIINNIKDILSECAEIQSMHGGDYYDDVLRAFSNTISVKIPNTY